MIATPLGQGGRGGIDRIMDEVRLELASASPSNLDVRFVTTRGQGHIGLSPLYLGRAIAQLTAARLAGQLDLLHVNLSSHGSTRRKIILCRAARLVGLPYVIHLHGSRFRQFFEQAGQTTVDQIAEMFRGAARILVLGRVWKDLLVAHLPEIAGRIEILANATRAPTHLAERRAGDVTILFLGKLGQRKGVPQLVEAFRLLEAVPGWRGILAGDGEVEQTRAELTRLGLADRVSLTGWVGPAEVEQLLSSAHILVLPSFDENLPMSVIEGMAFGLAVVATPVGAVEDVIHDNVTGLLTPVNDPAKLADTLRRLIADPALRQRLGDAAADFHRRNLDIGPYLMRLDGAWRAAASARLPA